MLFEVTPDDIKLLDDADFRQLVARLCEHEVRTQGHSPAAVTWGGHQNAPDGGIDVRVSLPPGATISGYVPAAASGFQVKAQDMPRQAILDEMAPGGVLRQSIVDLAAANGAYIIASSQGSVADTALTERERAMRDALAGKVSSGSLIAKFYDRTRIATWVNQNPGLIPWVRETVGRPISGWRPFADWSSSPAPLDTPYLIDDSVRLLGPSERGTDGLGTEEGVNRLRRILETPKGIVRLVGLSGVGKTRLVQALFDARIGAVPLPAEAVYTDISDSPDPVPLELVSQLIALRQRAILIVDNCGPDLHQKLQARITESNCLLSLITVEYDINDDEPENTSVFKLDVASVDLMDKILENRFPNFAAPSRRVIAEFSGGNSRIALALAATARNGESLANLRNRDLFERLFHQAKDKDAKLLNAAKACSLLYSFDGETLTGDDAELTPLACLAGISAEQLFAYVAELSRRQLVQKRGKWRAILPHAVAHRLAKLALEDIPFQRIESVIMQSGSKRMIRSFSKRIGYLHDDDRAKFVVSKWLEDGGFLEPIGNYNELGKACFTNVAPVDVEATCAFIERAAKRLPGFFGEQNHDRSTIVRVLRSIAYDPPMFDRAVALLKGFATDPSDTGQDSARGVFKSLFNLYLSGTHASPAQRAAVIGSLLNSADQAEKNLGLESLRWMLECGHFSSHYSFEFGARSRDYGSSPRTSEDIAEWFGQALKVAEAVGLQDGLVATEVRKIVAGQFSQLCARAGMMGVLITLAEKFSKRSSWPDGWLGVRSTIRRYRDKMSAEDLKELEALSVRLQPGNLEDLVRTYGLSKEWGTLDVIDTERDGGENPIRAHTRIQEVCFELGQKLAHNETQLQGMLPELLASNNQKMQTMGRGIANACGSVSDCWSLLSGQFFALPEGKRNPMLLAGFLNGAAQRSRSEADRILDEILADTRMRPHAVWFQCQAGLGGNACSRLMSALEADAIPVAYFEQIAYGGVQSQLGDETLCGLLRRIAAKEGGIQVAAEILGMRLFSSSGQRPPVSDAIQTVGRELLREVDFDERRTGHSELTLAGIIRDSLTRPEDAEIARILCERIKTGVRTYKINPWDVHDLIEALTKAFPPVVLDILVEQGNDDEATGRDIFRNIRGNRKCLLENIPDEMLMAWASERPQTRYAALAQAVRYGDAGDDENMTRWSHIAEKLIQIAPDPVPVLGVFMDRFEPTSWSGSRAAILATRGPLLQKLLEHTRPEVVEWARAAIPSYATSIERERAFEATRSRNRDERFEE